MSCQAVIYKGMFLADQLLTYYPDLHDSDFKSAMALGLDISTTLLARTDEVIE